MLGVTYLDFQLDKLGLINKSQQTRDLISQISYIEETLSQIRTSIEQYSKKTPN
ncbi:hypothetical protein D3C71_2129890 [compost metagenome]